MKKSLFISTVLTGLISHAASAGIIEPHVLWDKKELKTCFLSDKSQLEQTSLVSK